MCETRDREVVRDDVVWRRRLLLNLAAAAVAKPAKNAVDDDIYRVESTKPFPNTQHR